MSSNPPLSVGRLAAATGIPTETLRIWERRYGEPRSLRLASGHRRYPPATVARLRRVAAGLALGLRPGQVLGQPEAELERLLAARASESSPPTPSAWLEAVGAFRTERLVTEFAREADELGCTVWMETRLAPLLTAVGDGWAAGRLDIRHEHACSQMVGERLRNLRRRFAGQRGDPPRARAVLAGLSGEAHDLGLWMAAVTCEEHGVATQVLGAETPNEEIIAAARELELDLVGVGISLAHGDPATLNTLRELRAALPASVELAIGGAGLRSVRRGPRGTHRFSSLIAFGSWLKERYIA